MIKAFAIDRAHKYGRLLLVFQTKAYRIENPAIQYAKRLSEGHIINL
ncbi:hypothetical protein [Alkalimarinus sediminis]|uniref:Uncharacterized protein n=1 Tax=Alkalimarinus sediminis TaxID=1632866 RepID=A0A9E8HGE0_9ALTE|nr:hypothetical protein [Alkalimarinus sediminis]UZW74175.1 hypothetical protein NNL22_14265 [Alkalimarinus sediminis]